MQKKLVILAIVIAAVFSGCLHFEELTNASDDTRIYVTEVSSNPDVNYTPPSDPIEDFNSTEFNEIAGLQGAVERISSNQGEHRVSIPANESQLRQLRRAYNTTQNGLFSYSGEVYEVNQG